MNKEFIQLKISLNKSSPIIWRKIHLHNKHTFFELHHIIQITMGWKNYHMFEFNIEGYRIGEIFEDEKSDGFGSNRVLDSRTTKLFDVVSNVGDIIKYEYDFGDGWQHTLEVERFLDGSPNILYPICNSGEMACPPEDCGGIHGFYNALEILKDKKHPEYNDLKQWMPRAYDPMKFNLDNVNKQLDKLDKYITKWLKG